MEIIVLHLSVLLRIPVIYTYMSNYSVVKDHMKIMELLLCIGYVHFEKTLNNFNTL